MSRQAEKATRKDRRQAGRESGNMDPRPQAPGVTRAALLNWVKTGELPRTILNLN